MSRLFYYVGNIKKSPLRSVAICGRHGEIGISDSVISPFLIPFLSGCDRIKIVFFNGEEA